MQKSAKAPSAPDCLCLWVQGPFDAASLCRFSSRPAFFLACKMACSICPFSSFADRRFPLSSSLDRASNAVPPSCPDAFIFVQHHLDFCATLASDAPHCSSQQTHTQARLGVPASKHSPPRRLCHCPYLAHPTECNSLCIQDLLLRDIGRSWCLLPR